jgi:acetyl-CoA carboxylase biotin carboxylase subunit
LRDEDFQAARLDTGFLERLLGSAPATAGASESADVAAVAAALFTTLESAGHQASVGASSASEAGNWKRAALREGLR